MNKQLFAVLLLSAFPLLASAESFNKGDFRSAQKITRDGKTVVQVKLSKSGKAKVRKFNREAVGKPVHSEVGGVENDFRFREPILGDGLELGPFSESDAGKVIQAINQQ